MKRAENLTVMPYGGAWSDLGDWQAVSREGAPNKAGVVTTDLKCWTLVYGVVPILYICKCIGFRII